MVIRTKFNVGDKIYGISYQHRIIEFEVGKVLTICNHKDVEISYFPSDGKGGCDFVTYDEKYCFPTIHEAIAYVQGE